MTIVDIAKIEPRQRPSIDSPQLRTARGLASVRGRHGSRLVLAGTARRGDTAILASGTAGCR